MGLRILLIGDDLTYMMKDGAMLRAHGLRVYFCNDFRLVGDLMDETKPAVLFVNAKVHDEESTAMYHRLLDNVHYASIPVIYTLSANDVYLVNRKHLLDKDLPTKFSFEKDYLEAFVDEREFFAYKSEAYFIDIGIPEDYNKAQVDFKTLFG